MSPLILGAAFFCLGAGIAIFGVNPRRFTNRVFLVTSLLAAFWVASVWAAIRTQELTGDSIGAPSLWVRLNGVASLLWVWAVWLLSNSVTTARGDAPPNLRRFALWFVITAAASATVFSPYYLQAAGTNRKGAAYYALVAAVYIVLGRLAWINSRKIRELRGSRRVELQFLVLPLAIGSIAVLLIALLGNLTGIPLLKQLSFIPFIAGYGLSAWAMTFHRLYNPGEIFLSLLHIGLAIAISLAMGFGLIHLVGRSSIGTFDVVVSAAIAFSFGLWIEHRTRRWFSLRNEKLAGELRTAIAATTRAEPDPHALVAKFQELLRERNETVFVTLLLDRGDAFSGGNLILAKKRAGCGVLYEHMWATPESLERRRATPETEDLRDFLEANALAALVAAPTGIPAPALLIAAGEKKNGWPFTYPELERMQKAAELMENVLAHSRITAEAAVTARVEHLAMMSRGLAHDLKNLITPVSSFLVHTEAKVVPGTTEAEVHAAAKRSIALMTEYIREALFFANRLTPRFKPIPARRLLEGAADVVAARAQRSQVAVSTSTVCEGACRVDRVLFQRLLVNLLDNAIDACAPGASVTLSAADAADDRLRIQVSDTGSGISPEHRPRIFDPYFTTKQFGEDVRGFGLGLTICEKIIRLHGGEISVESAPGTGTVVTVEIPRNPPMSAFPSEVHDSPAALAGKDAHASHASGTSWTSSDSSPCASQPRC